MLKVPWCGVCAHVSGREGAGERQQWTQLGDSDFHRLEVCPGARRPVCTGTSAPCFGILLTRFTSSCLGICIHYPQPLDSESINSFNPIYK